MFFSVGFTQIGLAKKTSRGIGKKLGKILINPKGLTGIGNHLIGKSCHPL